MPASGSKPILKLARRDGKMRRRQLITPLGKWDAVQARVSDKPLRNKFGKALSTLDEAIAVKNQTSAAAAASHELDIVDELENYFKAS